jgi:hypothetical protein
MANDLAVVPANDSERRITPGSIFGTLASSWPLPPLPSLLLVLVHMLLIVIVLMLVLVIVIAINAHKSKHEQAYELPPLEIA